MARAPYHIARQQHLGDMLDALQAQGDLDWRWEYDAARSRAVFHIKLTGSEWRAHDTKSAEAVVQARCNHLGTRWRPVSHPGGEVQRAEAIQWIESSDDE